jgi:hypothetical protein
MASLFFWVACANACNGATLDEMHLIPVAAVQGFFLTNSVAQKSE